MPKILIILIINFGKGASRTGKTLPKFEMKKRCVGRGWRIRKGTKKFGRREEGFLMKKGYKEGGVSL